MIIYVNNYDVDIEALPTHPQSRYYYYDIYDPDASLELAYHSDCIARGHKYNLSDHRVHYDLRKILFLCTYR